jgi:hypothetical protein
LDSKVASQILQMLTSGRRHSTWNEWPQPRNTVQSRLFFVHSGMSHFLQRIYNNITTNKWICALWNLVYKQSILAWYTTKGFDNCRIPRHLIWHFVCFKLVGKQPLNIWNWKVYYNK